MKIFLKDFMVVQMTALTLDMSGGAATLDKIKQGTYCR